MVEVVVLVVDVVVVVVEVDVVVVVVVVDVVVVVLVAVVGHQTNQVVSCQHHGDEAECVEASS